MLIFETYSRTDYLFQSQQYTNDLYALGSI